MMIERLKARLVTDVRSCWRWSSVRLAIVAGALTSWAATDPATVVQLLVALPMGLRPLLGIALALVAIGFRITKSKETPDGE